MLKRVLFPALIVAASLVISAQDIKVAIFGSATSVMAIPDLRGAGDAQPFMSSVNRTLWDDIDNSGIFKMAPKSMYPPVAPQQPQDFRVGAAADSAPRGTRTADWSGAPVSANYLVFGYAAIQNGAFVLYGWVHDLNPATPQAAQVIGGRYIGSADESGAIKAAHEFAAEIITRFGGQPLSAAQIFFTSDRTAHKEIWAMDSDGSNQHQITKYNFIAQFPSLSPDGSKVALTLWEPGEQAQVAVLSTKPVRKLSFYAQKGLLSGTPSFTPDGRRIVYMAGSGQTHQIYIASLDGSNAQPITPPGQTDAEPKVNPRSGASIVFTSGRSGPQQIYTVNTDGSDLVRLTNGTGEASNPAWHPDGQHVAFAWTRGYSPGKYNIFVMNVASHEYLQLTRGEGVNENPCWSPGGTHIVFGSKRGGSYQIWTMRADGSDLRQLTSTGNNTNPTWAKRP